MDYLGMCDARMSINVGLCLPYCNSEACKGVERQKPECASCNSLFEDESRNGKLNTGHDEGDQHGRDHDGCSRRMLESKKLPKDENLYNPPQINPGWQPEYEQACRRCHREIRENKFYP